MAIAVAGFAGLLVISWLITFAIAPADVFATANQLGYLSADVAVLLPLSLAAVVGLSRERRWAVATFSALLGATGYAAAHLCSYLVKEGFLSIPAAAYVVGLVAILALLTSCLLHEQRLGQDVLRSS